MKKNLAILTILLMLGISAKAQSVTINPSGITPASSTTTYAVGQSYGGGIIFFVYDNGQHGLIASPQDLQVPFTATDLCTWSAVNGMNNTADLATMGAYADGIGGGMSNTTLINAIEAVKIGYDNTSGAYAALLCKGYSSTMNGVIYADWYLPSKYELNLMYLQRSLIGNLQNNYYWTSNEGDHAIPIPPSPYFTPYVWVQNMFDGTSTQGIKSDTYKVRAIRRF
jgi:hypothetical protein